MSETLWPRLKVLAFVLVIAVAGLAAVGLYRGLPSSDIPRQLTIPERDCGLLQHFSSLDALKAHLASSPVGWPWIYGPNRLATFADAGPASGSAAYSGTNNQVAGVDEADIVKTDGRYVYAATWNAKTYGSEVAIVRAYPAETAALVSRIPVDAPVQGLFVDGPRLAVISGSWSAYLLGGAMPVPYFYRSETRVLVYDLADPANPDLVRNVTVTGGYLNARLIGDVATLVVQDYLYLMDNGTAVVLPTVWTDGVPRDLTYADIGYFADSDGSNVDTIVLSVDLASDAAPAFESFLTRGVYQMYVSPSNVYVAGVEWDANPDRTFVAESSTVHKVAIADGAVHYVCSVKVPGTILNQFSMDERDGDLRVATTLGQWTDQGMATSAAVYVFDDLLNPIGSLTGLAAGERIFAARFLGDRAYLVTFRRVDPLFVLDVSDPRAPRVLGELKMPGVSDYIHPYDETHLIGVGMDDPSGTGRLHGLKLSLYDVADVEHPAELSSFSIGTGDNEWAYSEALYDHHAFLFVPSTGLLAIPVGISSWGGPTYGYWQGAYVFDVSLQSFEGIALRGTITHGNYPDTPDYWRYQVRRSLTIGDVLYTVSTGLVLGNAVDTLAEVARVPL